MSPEANQGTFCPNADIPSFDAKRPFMPLLVPAPEYSEALVNEPSKKNANFIHVAGIDSPGGWCACDCSGGIPCSTMRSQTRKESNVQSQSSSIITPKVGMQNLGPVGKK
jgi:hypothetical protein